jgi:hypothetical protein
LREISDPQFKLGRKAIISDAYPRRSVKVLEGIATITAITVIERVYKGTVRGKLGESIKSFEIWVNHTV